MNGDVISLEGAGVTFQAGQMWERRAVEAVKSVSFTIRGGETLGLVGESGSGKTTIGRICLGAVRPSRGEVHFEGRPFPRGRRALPGRLAVVLQHPEWALNPRLRAGVSVGEPLRVVGKSGAVVRRRVAEMLERVGLEPIFAERYPHELSGGQRQRLAIARALITSPRFVVFDEAVSALDVSVQTQVLNLVKELQEREGFAALFISHDLAATRYISHRIAVLYAGEIMELADAERFYGKPWHPYSRALRVSIAEWERESFELRGEIEAIDTVGCPLSPRCPWAIDRCRTERPLLRELAGGITACHRAEEVAEA